MTSKHLQASGWIALTAACAMLAVTAIASFSGGLHVEAGGVHMTMQASMDHGVQLVFAAAT